VAKALRKLDRRLATAAALPAGPQRDQALHEARKADKQLRYVTEIAAPSIGKPARRLAKQAKKLQDRLGEYQDALIARPVLHQLGAAAAAHNQAARHLLPGRRARTRPRRPRPGTAPPPPEHPSRRRCLAAQRRALSSQLTVTIFIRKPERRSGERPHHGNHNDPHSDQPPARASSTKKLLVAPAERAAAGAACAGVGTGDTVGAQAMSGKFCGRFGLNTV